MTRKPHQSRETWTRSLLQIVTPVFRSLGAGTLREDLPLGLHPGSFPDREKFTHLEAVGRALCGLTPWLMNPDIPGGEKAQQAELLRTVRAGLEAWEGQLNFQEGQQPLVDAAFFAQGLLRAGPAFWDTLSAPAQSSLLEGLRATRACRPYFNNWLLFSAMVETALHVFGGGGDRMRIDYALRQHEQWYKGDGAYGDGPAFHWDYYNSYVIHPMLVDITAHIDGWDELRPKILQRARRYAAVQERMIAADGAFPPLGRSLCYRGGAFHLLAQSALRDDLPEGLTPPRVCGALSAVLQKTLSPSATFDENGWLRPGLAGYQPSLAEGYISTGSLYLCCAIYLPLGLPAQHAFWTGSDTQWTAPRIWGGEDSPADHAMVFEQINNIGEGARKPSSPR